MLPPLTLLRDIDTETKIVVQMIAFYVMFSTLNFVSISEIGTLFFVNYMGYLSCNLRTERPFPPGAEAGVLPIMTYTGRSSEGPAKGHLF